MPNIDSILNKYDPARVNELLGSHEASPGLHDPPSDDPVWQDVQKVNQPVDVRGGSPPAKTIPLSHADLLTLYAKTKALRDAEAASNARTGTVRAGTDQRPILKRMIGDALKPSSTGAILGGELGGPVGAGIGWVGGKGVELLTNPEAREEAMEHPVRTGVEGAMQVALPAVGKSLLKPVASEAGEALEGQIARRLGTTPGELIAKDLAANGTGFEGVPASALREYLARAGSEFPVHPPSNATAARIGASGFFATPKVAQAQAAAVNAAKDLSKRSSDAATEGLNLADRNAAIPALEQQIADGQPALRQATAASEMEAAGRKAAGLGSKIDSAEGAARKTLPMMVRRAGKLADASQEVGDKTALEQAIDAGDRYRASGSSPELANVVEDGVNQAPIANGAANKAFGNSVGNRSTAGDLGFQKTRADYVNSAATYKAQGAVAKKAKSQLADVQASGDVPPPDLNADLSAADDLPRLQQDMAAKTKALNEAKLDRDRMLASGVNPDDVPGQQRTSDVFAGLRDTLGSHPDHGGGMFHQLAQKLASKTIGPSIATSKLGGAETLEQQALNMSRARGAVIGEGAGITPSAAMATYLSTPQPIGAAARTATAGVRTGGWLAGKLGNAAGTMAPYEAIHAFDDKASAANGAQSDANAQQASNQRQRDILAKWLLSKQQAGGPPPDPKDVTAAQHIIGLSPGLTGGGAQ